ncbi:unnamed protein product [Brassica oleracea]
MSLEEFSSEDDRSFLPSSGDERRRKEADEISGYRLTLSTIGNSRLEAFAAKRL